jgi:ATP-dependent exoDNAse (exonuclease V) alpha subunit
MARANKEDKTLWPRFFEVKETWFDLRALYASTINKAQGSTYDTVFLNLNDIGENWDANAVARLMYVGITRAAKQVVCYGQLPDHYT